VVLGLACSDTNSCRVRSEKVRDKWCRRVQLYMQTL
jgi:hypothetical protein